MTDAWAQIGEHQVYVRSLLKHSHLPHSSLDRNPRDLPRAHAPCLQQTEATTDTGDGNREQSLWYHKARFVTTTLFLVAFGQNAGFGLAGSHRWYLGNLDH